jgi:hypothetical protein
MFSLPQCPELTAYCRSRPSAFLQDILIPRPPVNGTQASFEPHKNVGWQRLVQGCKADITAAWPDRMHLMLDYANG